MRLLLDTHMYLWSITNDARLSSTARNMIIQADQVYVSAASIWEAVIKIKLGKLHASIEQLITAIEESGFLPLPVTPRHAFCVGQLQDLHRDPFDRMLVAQAISEPLRLLTADIQLQAYSELVVVL